MKCIIKDIYNHSSRFGKHDDELHGDYKKARNYNADGIIIKEYAEGYLIEVFNTKNSKNGGNLRLCYPKSEIILVNQETNIDIILW
jgi:hypothetical protein